MDAVPLGLPAAAGQLTSRPLRMPDVVAATQVVAACEQHDIGTVFVEVADVRADWQRPAFDLGTESVGVLDGERLVAVAEVYRAHRAEGYVLPDYRGRGIGSALLRWTWDVARARGGTRVGQTVPQSAADATALFTRHGYEPAHTSWVLELPAGVEIPAAPLPAGLRVRECGRGAEEHAAFQVIEDAFNEWPGRQPSTFEDWLPQVTGRDGFEPWNLLVATETGPGGEETVVGACHVVVSSADGVAEGWVNQVAVRPDRRNQGIARALLVAAFGAARERGAVRSGLSTDSRTGAFSLYEHVGMRVVQTFVHWARELP